MTQQTQASVSDLIAEAVERSFSDTAFMTAVPGEDLSPDDVAWTSSCVEFSGPLKGRMTLRLSRSLLPELAANIMGEDETPSEEDQIDALGEMINIICGVVLPGIKEGEDVYRIDSPHTPPTDTAEAPHNFEMSFAVDEGHAHLILAIDKGLQT